MSHRAIGPLTLRGRTFSRAELLEIQRLVASSPHEHRSALSKRVCRTLGWYQHNGRLKDRSCRDVLLKLEALGLLRLPPRRRPPVRRRPIPLTDRSAPYPPLVVRPRDVGLDHVSIVTGSRCAEQERQWNEYVERYHPLGFGVSPGPHVKYCVMVNRTPIACLAFGGAAWKIEARDRWIGWGDRERKAGLHRVVNNTRFVILPWARTPNLASRILSLAVRRLGDDWSRRYGYRPLLLETFVHAEAHRGSCYRAANWRLVGHTKGRGRMDRHFRADQPRKLVFVYPLDDHAVARLRSG